MRSYSNAKSPSPYFRSSKGIKKERKVRESLEWDVRLDIVTTPVADIVERIKNSDQLLSYALVSGIEQPDSDECLGSRRELHVHIAIITKYLMRRDQVLTLLRGPLSIPDEYCVPRNKKFTYAGWFMHHTKMDMKTILEPAYHLEVGILPEDATDDQTKASIKRMFKKFGSDDTQSASDNKQRFLKWLQ